MREIPNKKVSKNTLIVILLLYFFIYFGRYTTNTALVNFIKIGFLTKSQAGGLTSFFYLIYSIVIFFSVFLCNKKHTYIFLTLGGLGVAACNLGLYFSQSYTQIAVFYATSAGFHAVTFNPIFVIINTNLQSGHRNIGVRYFSLIYPMSRLLDSLLIILSMYLGSFRYLFLFAVVFNALISITWFFHWHTKVNTFGLFEKQKKAEIEKEADTAVENEYSKMPTLKIMLISGFFVIVILSMLRAILNNSSNTWIPPMISETFNKSALMTHISTLVFPLLNFFGILIGLRTLKKVKNEMLVAALFFALSLIPYASIIFMEQLGFFISLLMFSLIHVFSYSYFAMFNSNTMSQYKKTGRLPLISSLINIGSSLGFVLSGYTFGHLADNYGWRVLTVIWLIMSAVALILSLSVSKRWERFRD